MNVQQLNVMLMEARATAIATRRKSLITAAAHHRANARMYTNMGLYSVAARETIKAATLERNARDLTAAAVEVLL